MKENVDRVHAFFFGMTAGWAQVAVMQPFQIIKVRLQTQNKQNLQYKGITDCFSKIVKNEGFLAFYKGTLTPLITIGLMMSVKMGVYQNLKKQIGYLQGRADGVTTLPEKTVAAFFSGVISAFISCPVQHSRIRIQIQRGQVDKVYSGSVDAAIKIFKQHGLRGLYRGLLPSLVRQATGVCMFITTAVSVTEALTPAQGNMPIYVPFLAGGLGGTMYWVFNYPFDYVKTLMQTDKFGAYKYTNMVDCFKQQYAAGGWRNFYKGYLICMMRSFPVNAAAITSYHLVERVSKMIM